MAVIIVGYTADSYIAYGLNADTKPASPPAASLFIETDTAKVFRVVGGVWTESINTTYSSWPTMTGNANKKLQVNAGETGVEWVTVAGGGDMLSTNNLSDLGSAATARTNLGVTTQANTLLAAYPVGSIYISTVSTNPNTYFGGTWAAFATGRTIVGIDAAQTEFDTVEETGGSKTHTLTTAEMPAHTHTQDSHNHTQNAHTHVITSQTATTGSATSYEHGVLDTSSAEAEATEVTGSTTATNIAATAVNQNTGGGGAHNNLQPYIVVYMFKRTA